MYPMKNLYATYAGEKNQDEGRRGYSFHPEKRLRLERFFAIRTIINYITVRLSHAFFLMVTDHVIVGESGREGER